ncbi:pyridoxal phosphate-dependent aminotransferase [Desulfitobacterium sp. THU1]|uniref:pyridoxal phosphate-dependent aminotransferase n=1 Tax=Desulfitobacterium sp. THU1 TaxID=3138072 RepID=UPI00311F6A12
MKAIIAERMDRLVASGVRKINEKAMAMKQAGEQVLHFEYGRPDFDTPGYIKRAVIESVEAGEVFYTSGPGMSELREAITEKLQRDNNISYDKSEILVTVGLSEAIFHVLSTILDEGDEILIPDPVWMNYLNVPRYLGAVPVSYGLREENEYQVDLEEIRSKITARTKAMVIVTPNNPTGGVLSEQTLRGIADMAISRDIWVISDEIYERLIYDNEKHISIASLPGMKERTFTMNGFSKAYSMTGWRIGYVAAPQEMIATLNKIHEYNTICAPSFAQKASVIALQNETDEVADMVKEYKRRRDYAVKAINEIGGLSCLCPKGAFYIFINIKQLPMTSAEFAEYLLDTAKMACVPGEVFGEGGKGYLRMCFANSYENIVEGCRRLKEAVDSLRE